VLIHSAILPHSTPAHKGGRFIRLKAFIGTKFAGELAMAIAAGASPAAIVREIAMLFSPRLDKPAIRLFSAAHGVRRLRLLFANAYLLEGEDGRQVLVDTGLSLTATLLQWTLPARPAAVVLTHGHFDHAGGAGPLAHAWGVPVYAHSLELPYLTGQAAYSSQDLLAGGPVALVCRFFRNEGFHLSPFVRPLPENGTVPHLPGWRWLHTPGHAPGHVALFRESDRTLVSGDALLTTDVGSWVSVFTGRQKIAGPPAPSTPDWPNAIRSIRALARLDPRTVAAGHGAPMSGPNVAAELHGFAGRFNEDAVRTCLPGSVSVCREERPGP
jgi:glyoxylase-like metal-dependent hydrolase (beta-lactamase superfamily II)